MAAKEPPKAMAEPGPGPTAEVRSLPEPHPNQKHGLYSKAPIIRALLGPAEAEAWDAAPVPADCPEILEDVFREYFVLKFRVHAFERSKATPGPGPGPGPKSLADLAAVLRAYHIPLRGLIKAVEVHARMKEAEQVHDMGDSVLAYLRTLPAHRLEDYMFQAEAPRFDPVSGRLLTDVSHETPDLESDDDRDRDEHDRDGPNPGGDAGAPDPGGPGA